MKLEIWSTQFNHSGDLVFSGYSDVVPRVGERVEVEGASLVVTWVTYLVEDDSLSARVLVK